MRILIDLGEDRVGELDRLSKRERKSRAAVIRQALDEYLSKRRAAEATDAFGLWGKGAVDGLKFQNDIRSEW